ncbi:Ubp1-associated protein 2a [Thalictrum thalictroides]|uniref:Ubp1-associated protein 2a n=1 Tax=Thalictrum thalictroides TaxID=46969 RepID=A0A7J6W318_THATH|nr:Ubp1-associated protein 2a [Thalictrum thalictroides]
MGGGDDEEDEEKQLKDENTPVQNDIQTKVTESNHNPNPNGGGGEKKEEEDDDDGEEPVQNLLEPFTKDQLMEILREAAENHSDVLEHIRKLSDTDPVHRKIFVHGLGWDTNSEVLTEVFNKYGEIEDCNAVTDKITGKSKGYAFILFKHRSGARKALKEPQKKIGSRMTACQLASAGPVPTQSQAPVPPSVTVSEYTQRKIYVSNVSADIDPQKLVTFFSKFGEIEEGPLGLDKQTGKPKGFALFVYRSVESAKKALEEPHKTFEGHVLHCQKAIDGPKPNKHYNQHQQHAHGGGRPSKFPRTDNSNFGGNHASGGAGGHLMAQSAGAGMQFNQGASQALNPVLGQALTALLTTQSGGGLGLTNLLGTLGSTGVPINPAGPPMMNTAMQGGYGHHHAGSGYGGQPGMQGGYSHSQMGQGSAGRSQKGYTGGHNPYMGH